MQQQPFKTEGLGPRQLKAVKEAVSHFDWRAKARIEITGVHGKPETERRSEIIAGVVTGKPSEQAVTARAGLLERYPLITPANYEAAVNTIKQATDELVPPELDNRISQEDHAENMQRVAENQAKREEALSKAAECWAVLEAKRPSWAKAMIVAELRVDDSDSMTDYFASHAERRVVIGWQKSARNNFRNMRKAAATFEHTKHLGPEAGPEIEHRENYSMGRGYYLCEGRTYSGWQVRLETCEPDKYNRGTIYEDGLPASGATVAPETPPAALGGVTITENADRDGVELRFPDKPDEATRDALKAHRFRWHRRGKFWYAKRTPERLEFARSLAGGEGVNSSTPELSKPTGEDAYLDEQHDRGFMYGEVERYA